MLGHLCIFLFTMKTVHLILFLSFITSVFLDQLQCFVYTWKTTLASFEEFSVRVSPCCPCWSWRYSCRVWLCRWSLNIREKHVSLKFVATYSVKGFAVLPSNVRIFMTSEAPVWWVDKCLEGFPQTSNQQLFSEQSSTRVFIDSVPINIFF